MLPILIDSRPNLGLLLVGHGTRSTTGRAQFLHVAELIAAERPDWIVEPCFLELAEPDIPTGLTRLLAQNIENLMVAPVLLFAAGHAKEDIPQAVAAALADQRPVTVHQAAALECHPAILALSARRFDETLADQPPVPAEETLLLMVGRGSRDAAATAEMERFGRLRGAQSPVGQVRTCFYAMAEPALEDVLPAIAAAPFRRVVVQPHLLFPGDLLTALTERIEAFARQQSHQQWLMTAPLGADEALAGALIELAQTITSPEVRLKC